MAVLAKPGKYATQIIGESLTEQEHLDSCDINKMLKAASRGQHVRGGKTPKFGFDDTTMDGLQHRIQKQRLENELQQTFSNHEFTEEQINAIPDSVKEKFAGKIKLRKKDAAKNDQTIQASPNAQNQNAANNQNQKPSAGSNLPDEKPSADSTHAKGRNPNS